jgi:hypothetical protein
LSNSDSTVSFSCHSSSFCCAISTCLIATGTSSRHVGHAEADVDADPTEPDDEGTGGADLRRPTTPAEEEDGGAAGVPGGDEAAARPAAAPAAAPPGLLLAVPVDCELDSADGTGVLGRFGLDPGGGGGGGGGGSDAMLGSNGGGAGGWCWCW